ncbi:MAG: tetratricopeptide repeat protein [Myxococcales bacterium]|nr:tetratricopeptide repeat protein [Myxococcales bacterium]
MPEHTIPNSLVENICNGRAAIIVGAGIGVASWKQLLEEMNAELRGRGAAGDEASAKDVDKLLHKGNMVRAAAFLGRQLGSEVCDKVVAETWASSGEAPEIAKALAGLPLRQMWTTFPGDVLERAMGQNLPDDWPLPTVLTYKQAGEIDKRRRTVLKVLGDFDSFIATPKSIRQALSGADELREFVRPYYAEGSLLFIGFRYGDPDLAALLDRVFGSFEPTESEHFMACAGVGPVTVDELASDHHITVLNLPGKGIDEEANSALLELLGDLKAQCAESGLSLAKMRPEADDLEGWIGILHENEFDQEALEMVSVIETQARDAEDSERLVEVLMLRIELTGDSEDRAALLREVASVFETLASDASGAFTAYIAALGEDPSEISALDSAERLAGEVDGWTELVADVGSLAGEIEDKKLAAVYYARLGRWYHRKLDHIDYGIASYREALRRDSELLDAYEGLGEAYRVQQRWGELADLIDARLEHTEDVDAKFDLHLAIADICESQLASTPRAIDAYESALALDTNVEDAFVALERLFRQSEHWGKLAKVLERKADFLEKSGNSAQATQVRRDITSMRADKLGDLEGSIGKHETALQNDPNDIEALQALEELYDKLGRTEDYLKVLTTLAEVSPDEERPALLRRLAMELEEQEDGQEAAIAALSQLLDVDVEAQDAYRSLERLHRDAKDWEGLVAILERHAFVEKSPSERTAINIKIADVQEAELADPHRAVEALENAISDSPDNVDAMSSLSRMYKRTEAWQQAADMYAQHAEHLGKAGAAQWAHAGHIAFDNLQDVETARQYLEKALELSAHNLEALTCLARLHKSEGAWESAVNRLVDAADASANRLDRVGMLQQASALCESKLGDAKRGLNLLRRVLEVDPENIEAGLQIAESLVAAEQWREALPVLEMIVRRTDPEDRIELSARSMEVGRICTRLGEHDKAEEHLSKAVELDAQSLDAALALGDALFAAALLHKESERWLRVDKHYRSMLARHRSGLADSQVVDLWHRLGVTAQHLGETGKAEAALRRALERDSGHESTLRSLAELAAGKEDWKTMVACKRDLLDSLGEDERCTMLEEIGDLCQQKLGDTETALGAYLEASHLRPGSRTLLHKALELLTAQKQWRQAVDVLDALSKSEKTPTRRAKFHYTAAVICRDELEDVDLAVEFFTRALDDNPETDKAFEAIDSLLSSKGDWKALARTHRKMLKAIGEQSPEELQLRLWTRLGDICSEHLGDTETAITALEVATSLDPSDMKRLEQLVNLYLEVGDRREDVIEGLQALISDDPDRVEFYKVLSEQYRAQGEMDKAYCVAQALVFLKAANEDEGTLYSSGKPQSFVAAKRRLTEELWQKAVIHNREDRHVNAIFSSIIGQVAATTSQPLSAFNFEGKSVSDDGSTIFRVFRYASGVLGLSPEPTLFVEPESAEGLRVANTIAEGKLRPTLVAGKPHAANGSESELAFELGKRMAYFRPERYLNFALQTLPKLEGAFYGALDAAGKSVEGHGNGAMSAQLRKSVPTAVLEQVGVVASKMHIEPSNGVISGWRSAIDLTANRVGLILCNDLQIAARSVATEKSTQSTLSAKDRLRDLLAYSVSEEYFAVRKHLGLGIDAQAQ